MMSLGVKGHLEKAQGVMLWMMFLLAANTGVVLTLLRERIVFRKIRDEIAGLLPPGYDPKRLDYPYIFPFTTPPAWAQALARHVEQQPEHQLRTTWDRFRRMRNVLMIGEGVTIVAFVGWVFLS